MVELPNISENYNLTGRKRYGTSNNTQKHLLYKQFVPWHCNGCTVAPLTEYNPIYQELPNEAEYLGEDSDEQIYIDLRASYGYTNEIEEPIRSDLKMTVTIERKNALSRKIRLRVWGYTNGEYLYMLLDSV